MKFGLCSTTVKHRMFIVNYYGHDWIQLLNGQNNFFSPSFRYIKLRYRINPSVVYYITFNGLRFNL